MALYTLRANHPYSQRSVSVDSMNLQNHQIRITSIANEYKIVMCFLFSFYHSNIIQNIMEKIRY